MKILVALLCIASVRSADVEYDWIFKTSSSLGSLGVLVAAYQAAKSTEGADDQAIYFEVSSDLGKTWSDKKVVASASQAVWGPAFHYENSTDTLWMFYSQSVPENIREKGRSYPGGDIKYITSSDVGVTWSSPKTILTFVDRNNVSKVTANKPIVTTAGNWILPFWQEPHTANDKGESCAGVLVSNDQGQSWVPYACISSKETKWLIENAVAEMSNGSIYQIFRTTEGHIYQAVSHDDGLTWSEASRTVLLNPNSKTFMFSHNANKELVIAYNPSKNERTPLALTISRDDAATWNDFVTLEDDPKGSFAYPTSVPVDNLIYTDYSASIHDGIKLAITSFPQ